MQKRTIDFSITGTGSPFFRDYISGKPELSRFYSFRPQKASFAEAIAARKKYPVDRALLSEVISGQYAGLSNVPEAVLENIRQLKNDDTFTVTTGHQLSLFTGPLYFIYKIVSAIRLAQDLSEAYPDYRFVPVYWMNTDDHDFEEINHFYFRDQKFVYRPEGGTGNATGKISTSAMPPFFEELASVFKGHAAYNDALSVFRKGYLGHANLADAMRFIVNAFFGSYGLVILDQDSEALKKSFSKIALEDIRSQKAFEGTEATIAEMESMGYPAQVKPREINFFYTGHGRRDRIIAEDGLFRVLNTGISWTAETLEEAYMSAPADFSPNVVTRPLYEEFVLPNLAYIGGPAEVHYWMQYRRVFEQYHIFFPVLVMRDSFLLMEEKDFRKIDRLGLTLEDFFGQEETVIRKYLDRRAGVSTALDGIREALQSVFSEAEKIAAAADPTLSAAAKAEQHRSLQGIDRLESKIIRSVKVREEQATASIRDVRSKIFPGGSLQERRDNLLSHTTDPAQLISRLLSIADPLDASMKLMLT